MGTSGVTKERPVSNRDVELRKRFNDTLAKSRLLYDNIEVHPRCLCAIISNGAGDEVSDIKVIYTSSIDGKVYTNDLNYIEAEFADREPGFKQASIKVRKKGTLGTMVGLLRHNGKLVVKPLFDDIIPIPKDFMFLSTISDFDDKYSFRLADYNGNIFAKGFDYEILEDKLIINNDKASVVMLTSDRVNQKVLAATETLNIFLLLKGEVYSILEGYRSSGVMAVGIDSENNTIQLKTTGKTLWSSKIEEVTVPEIMEKAYKLKAIGKIN